MDTPRGPATNDLLRHLCVPFAVYVPVAAALIALALPAGAAALPLVVVGITVWSFFEYWMHRLLLHMLPRGRVRRYISGRHILHHRSPLGHPGIVVLWISALVFVVVVAILWAAFGGARACAVMAGIVAGYLAYEYTHLANHLERAPVTPWGQALRRHHLAHHDIDPRTNYAILLPLWDYVFATALTRGGSPNDGLGH